jgi:glyoxylase-like metal-dependent hydrolase (beta-lactamase superfamily II)
MAAVAAAMALAAAPLAQVAPAAPPRSITQVTGDLYAARNNNHHTIFLVTPQGIVLGDPISADFSQWLKGELGRRFPNRPVRFVLLSHHHFDHASGAAVWNDTAEIIAQENFGAELKRSAAARPDRYRDVRPPESTFRDRRRITLGGKTVEMIHPGPNHSRDASVLYFPAERAVFVVDFITLRHRFPGGLADSAPLGEWLEAIRAVEALDFDRAVVGHGEVGTKQDVAAYRQYFTELLKVVGDGVAGGQTVEQLQATSALDKYKEWVDFPEAKNRNIAEAYAQISAQRR